VKREGRQFLKNLSGYLSWGTTLYTLANLTIFKTPVFAVSFGLALFANAFYFFVTFKKDSDIDEIHAKIKKMEERVSDVSLKIGLRQ
jgi:hypothetical protein